MKDMYIKAFDSDDSTLCDATDFRSLLGAMMQLTDCRPDIAFALSKISQRQATPRQKDKDALIYVVNYLYTTKDLGLILRRGDTASAKTLVRLQGYTDMSFACHGNGRSQYCNCFDLVDETDHCDTNPLTRAYNTGMFMFRSFMAPTVDLCTSEGEVGAAVELGKDALFYRSILKEIGQEQVQPTPLYGDNDSMITLATSYSGKHKRVRYMLPRINWLMEQTKALAFKMYRLGTTLLPADVGTKNGQSREFRSKRACVMGAGGNE